MKNNQRLGPAPWGTSGEQTDATPAERVLAAVGQRTAPVGTAELAAELGLHGNTVRTHLQDLVTLGLVARHTDPPAGRGRPAHRYEITDEGRAVPGPTDPAFAEYRGLTSAFASYLARTSEDPSREARAIGRVWGEQLSSAEETTADAGRGASPVVVADPAAEPVALLTRLLTRLGFTPVLPDEGGPAHPGIALRTCPLLDLAEEMPEVICQVHRGLVEGALGQYGAGGTVVDLVPFSEPGACRLLLDPPVRE